MGGKVQRDEDTAEFKCFSKYKQLLSKVYTVMEKLFFLSLSLLQCPDKLKSSNFLSHQRIV